jgi:hypothetical protein
VKKDIHREFQTPPEVCAYMASLVPAYCEWVLEPTPGDGNLVDALVDKGFNVVAPSDYFMFDRQKCFDAIAMNPPFSASSAILDNAPLNFKDAGMRFGYQLLNECMQRSDHVVALMPWFTLTDSDRRMNHIKKYGLVSLTALPRKTFEYARIQTVVMKLQRGYKGETEFKVFKYAKDILKENQHTLNL